MHKSYDHALYNTVYRHSDTRFMEHLPEQGNGMHAAF